MHWTEIFPRAVGEVVVLDVRGYMTLGDQESVLFRSVSALCDQGCRGIVLNLEHVSYVDSVGIGEIIRSNLHLARHGGALRLCGVGPRVGELLQATQLDRVLQILDTEAEAVSSAAAFVGSPPDC